MEIKLHFRRFSQTMALLYSYDFPERDFLKLKHKSKVTGDCCVVKFLQRSVNGKHLMRFQSGTSKFLRRSVWTRPIRDHCQEAAFHFVGCLLLANYLDYISCEHCLKCSKHFAFPIGLIASRSSEISPQSFPKLLSGMNPDRTRESDRNRAYPLSQNLLFPEF